MQPGDGTAFEEGYAFSRDQAVAQAGLERGVPSETGSGKAELIEGKLPLEIGAAFEGNGIHMLHLEGQKKDDLFIAVRESYGSEEILSF